MCDPLTIGLALSGASVASNAIAQNKIAAAREDALNAEKYRQTQLADEAAALNAQSQDRYKDFGEQQDEASSKLGDYFAEAPSSATAAVDTANSSAASVMPTATNDIVQREVDKQSGKATTYTNQQANALGNLRSFGDVMGDISLDQARDAGYIGQINGFRQSSSNVLPYELEDANSAGAGFQFLGDVLGLAGSAVTPMGINSAVQAGTTPSWLSWASKPATNISKGAVTAATKASPSALAGML